MVIFNSIKKNMRKIEWIHWRIKAVFRAKKMRKYSSVSVYSMENPRYGRYDVRSAEEINHQIYNQILSGEAFLAGRFGAVELLNMRTSDFGTFVWQKYGKDYHFNQLCQCAGFFPNDSSLLTKYTSIMRAACEQVDYLGVWYQPFEDYYMKYYMHGMKGITYLLNLEPWSAPENPWTAALEGKKVLVIHPFAETIERQYKRRETIFPGTNILPVFELKTLKAVQTIAGEKDNRFATWFDALDWMFKEAIKIDFDIAIIGCGAYGLPLAAKLKAAGKQAFHLAGATQLLFGIKGKRWEENDAFGYVRKFFNDNWVYPSENDKPKQASNVEGGCYW